MKTNIDIYIITSDHLKLRFNNLNQQISKLKNLLEQKNYNYTFHQINNPSESDIVKNIDKFKERIDLNKDNIEDNDFKNLITPINTYQLSNFSKHLKAFELIKNSENDLHFIIEDDMIVIDDFTNNILHFLDEIRNKEYDLIFTAVSINQPGNLQFLNSYNYFKVLIAKSSYLISKKCATELIDFMNKIYFSFKINLSYYIWKNRETIKSFVLNKNLLFEGSKIGLFTTSLNNTNFLYQNGEFVRLTQLIGDNEYLDNDIIKKVEEIYNNSGKNNPDFQHTLGLAYYKNKNYKKAKEVLIEAMNNFKKNDGFICQHNEILNNCINMHQYEQSDIDNVLKLQGIYS
jgi:hypothetical protein